METVGLGIHFEELPLGRQFQTIGRTVTEADIVNFINCTGMVEVLFTNIDFLQHGSDIKGRVAPGALVYTFAEGLLVQRRFRRVRDLGQRALSCERIRYTPVLRSDGQT